MLNLSNNGEKHETITSHKHQALSPSQHNEVGTWLIYFTNIWLMYLSILHVYVLNGTPLHFPHMIFEFY
jgi:hypothetical protein